MKNNLRRIVVRELWALVAPVYRGSQWSKGVVPEKKKILPHPSMEFSFPDVVT